MTAGAGCIFTSHGERGQVNLAHEAAQSETIQALSLVLNVLQAVALAWIASRSSRIRAHDRSRDSD
jgi:hypothetical protein